MCNVSDVDACLSIYEPSNGKVRFAPESGSIGRICNQFKFKAIRLLAGSWHRFTSPLQWLSIPTVGKKAVLVGKMAPPDSSTRLGRREMAKTLASRTRCVCIRHFCLELMLRLLRVLIIILVNFQTFLLVIQSFDLCCLKLCPFRTIRSAWSFIHSHWTDSLQNSRACSRND